MKQVCGHLKRVEEMKLETKWHGRIFTIALVALFTIIWNVAPVLSYPVKITDSMGNLIAIEKRPECVVSLVPSITEIILKIGAGNAVKAVTYHDTYSPEMSSKKIVGGFFSPSVIAIEKMEPDVIFVSRLHERVRERFRDDGCQIIDLESDSIADTCNNILLVGRIFNKENEAAGIVHDIKKQLQTISKKVAKIPDFKRKRVIRLMGRDSVMVPGDDSFQNEMIRAAGGIPPVLSKKGDIVVITKEEWMKFNPQVIYGCGADRETARKFFNRPGWKDVDAVKNGKIFYFPCNLTCRASTNTGYFVSWLSARIYTDEFSKKENQVFEEKIFKSRKLDLDLNYIRDARIAYSIIHDFSNKTLIIDFKQPLSVVSTLEGQRDGVESVGNHYLSPPCWGISHKLGLKKIGEEVYKVIGESEDRVSFLFTGADMDNLAIKRERFRQMEVYALVTAGVKSNAVRMSADEGRFYEPGTINIILLPNMQLTSRAMTRAIISATEAKTAALMDLDIRSSYTPFVHQATGTGTDNIIVVEGTGKQIDNAGGHSKMGELIAKVVYKAVQEAIYKQNGIVAQRNIFQRLKERKISVFDLINSIQLENMDDRRKLVTALEAILLDPKYASFIQASFALSDDYERGLVIDLSAYDLWCERMAEEIAGKNIAVMKDILQTESMPLVLHMALNTIFNGLYHKSN